jgi:hypothetical protein
LLTARSFQPCGVDAVLGVRGVLFKIGHKLIDLDRLEAEDRDVKTLRFQQGGQFRDFDRKALTIPARVLRDLVVSNRKGALSRRRKSGQHDDRHCRQAEELCRLVAALAGDECPVFSDQQGVGEAERHDAVGDLADLLAGMGPGITPIELDLIDRERLHPHGRALELATSRATGVAWNALPLRTLSAIRLLLAARVNSHVHSPKPVDMASAVFAPALRRPPPVQNHFELQFGALSLACALAIAIGAPSFTNGGPSPGIRANDPMGPPELHALQLACAQEFIHSAPTHRAAGQFDRW